MKIVLADDHRLVLEALESYLTQIRPDIEILMAANLDEAIEHLTRSKDIDLVVLDLHMPGMDGLKSVGGIREKHPDLPVVILSGQADGQKIRETMAGHVNGFIPKNLSGKAMLAALELVLAGEPYIPKAALIDPQESRAGGRKARFSPDNPLTILTGREIDVLDHLVKGQANKEIARELGSSNATVAFHLKNVYRKLEVSNRTQAVSKAIGCGIQA